MSYLELDVRYQHHNLVQLGVRASVCDYLSAQYLMPPSQHGIRAKVYDYL